MRGTGHKQPLGQQRDASISNACCQIRLHQLPLWLCGTQTQPPLTA